MRISRQKYIQLIHRDVMFFDVTFFDEKSLRTFAARPIDIVNAYETILDIVESGLLMPGAVTLNTWYKMIGLPPTYSGWKWAFKPETDIFFRVNKDSNMICIDFDNIMWRNYL